MKERIENIKKVRSSEGRSPSANPTQAREISHLRNEIQQIKQLLLTVRENP